MSSKIRYNLNKHKVYCNNTPKIDQTAYSNYINSHKSNSETNVMVGAYRNTTSSNVSSGNKTNATHYRQKIYSSDGTEVRGYVP